ncbi:MAG: hypothetical protein CM1200mP39_25650 [Dehalococcoidia bacterium]|nr:MAG: hypothetical protein CM1200mP39_25650 [Dehalococcoidia bacterium]
MLTKGGPTPIPFLEELAAEHKTGHGRGVIAQQHGPGRVFSDLSKFLMHEIEKFPVWGQVSCCPLSTEFTLKAPYPFEGLSAWQPAMRADLEEGYKKLFSDPSFPFEYPLRAYTTGSSQVV